MAKNTGKVREFDQSKKVGTLVFSVVGKFYCWFCENLSWGYPCFVICKLETYLKSREKVTAG